MHAGGVDPSSELGDLGLSAFLDAAPDGIVVVDEDGTIRSANHRAAELFGAEADDLLGRNVDDLLPERLRPRHADNRAEYMEHPRPRPMGTSLDLVARRLDGTEFPVDVSLNALELGGPSLVVAFVRDATQRRRAEREAARLRQADQRRRQALELNDDVVQALAAAKMALELGEVALAEDVIGRAIGSAKRIVADLLSESDARPGALRRGAHI